jgi:hypothetical protein
MAIHASSVLAMQQILTRVFSDGFMALQGHRDARTCAILMA